jgi:pimeloyl-ACP methyl ester carboxylesterase
MPKAKLKTGVELYYEDHGTGVPVILLQGTGFALDVWQPHPVRELSANHRAITIDPRGIGRSRMGKTGADRRNPRDLVWCSLAWSMLR